MLDFKIKTNDVFNLSDISDLSFESKQQIRLRNFQLKAETRLLLNLFNIKSQLTINEIIAGLERLHGIKRGRNWVSKTLNNLKTSNLIKKIIGTDKYELCK